MSITRPLRSIVRLTATAVYRLLRRERPGAHALAMTPAGEVILVKLRYARGWRLPGGGRSARESPAQAVVRELREEIGLTAHGRLTPLSHIDPALVLVEDVIFETKRWSLEVERVTVAPTNALPHDISPLARRWIRAAGPSLPR